MPMSLEVIGLEHIYGSGSPFEQTALSDISFTIEDGSFVGLIGHTGSGKSTLIQHLNGLLKPTAGTVIYNGIDIFSGTKSELIKIRQKIGMVFQYPEHQLFEETVAKDVAFGPRNMGLDPNEITRRVRNSLAQVDLDVDKVGEKSPFELSGGQMRRVAIAGVLAMEPEVLILDEPTAGLDPRGRKEIQGQIEALHRDQGITVILVSHSMEDVGRLSDKIIVMDHGKMVFFDTPAKIFREIDAMESIGLAVPATTYLMRDLERCYPAINRDVFTVEDAKKAILDVMGEECHAE